VVRSKSNTNDRGSNQKSRPARRNQKSDAKDDEVIKVVKEMKKVEIKMLRDKEWRKENSLMLRDRKVYML